MAGILEEFLLIFRPQVQGSGFQQLNQQTKSTFDNLFSLKNLFKTFVGYDIYSGLKQFGAGLVQTSKDLGAMTSRFYAITKSEKLANDELQWTFDLANRTAMGLKATADSYSIFYSATQKSIGTEGARQVFQDWTEVSRVLHLSEYQFERVTYALREMASKGAIYSQDLRMQIGTHVPNAMGLAEKAINELGVTGTNWFDDFREQAKGNQKLINQFIVLFSKYAKEMYASPEALAKAMEKPDAQIQKLFNTWEQFKISIVQAGFEKDLVNLLKIANGLLSAITAHAKEIYAITKAIIGLLAIFVGGKALIAIVKVVKNLVTFLQLLGWVKGLKDLAMLGTIIRDVKGLGTIGKFLPLLARILPFLTNPYVLGALLIAGGVLLLKWVLKKFFPNVWLAIENIWDYMWSNIREFGRAVKALFTGEETPDKNDAKDREKANKDALNQAIDRKLQDIKAHGNEHNDKYSDVGQLKKSLKSLKHLSKDEKQLVSQYSQQEFKINIVNQIDEVKSAEDFNKIIQESALDSKRTIGNIFKK